MRKAIAMLTVGMFGIAAIGGDKEGEKNKAKPEAKAAEAAPGKPAIPPQLTTTGILIQGKVTRVSRSESGMTENSWTKVIVSVSNVYRGELKKGDDVEFSIEGWLGSEKKDAQFYRTDEEVIVPLRKVYNPFLKSFNSNYGGSTYRPSGKPLLATEENVRHAAATAGIPIGWNYNGKELISTWSAVDKAVFRTKDAQAVPMPVCAKTKRPGYLTDSRLELSVDLLKEAGREPDPAIFEISITNPTDKPIKVESLRSFDGKVLWNESILFVNYAKVWLPVGFEGFTENTEATIIQPGQTLKGEMPWTAQFSNDTLVCLGNKSFSIYINVARNYELFLKDGTHPKPPFQLKAVK